MKVLKNSLIIVAGLFMFSCIGEFKEISISSINDFKVTKLTPQGIEGEIKVTINNPNPIGFKVFRSKADIMYGDVKLGKAKLVKKVKIAANSSVEHTFLLKGNLKDASLSDIPGLLIGKNKQMEIKGYIKAGKWYYKKRFPIDEKQRLKGLDFKGGIPGF
ncbi:MAG TPA: LEA type 2 family protein [Bacteroidia bacterium]|jgi:LEA14-like dessication related protein|nr:LEA type 2 family protein [Bacteroidia bacterium]